MLTTINCRLSICDLVKQYPEVKDIMVELGFRDIIKPGMLQTAGKIMTIEKGAAMKHIDQTLIEKTFKKHGFLLIKEDIS